MAGTGFRNLIVSFILISLFFFALLSFGINLAINNSSNQSILDNNVINTAFGNLSTQIGTINSTAATQLNATQQEAPQQPTGDFTLTGVIGSVWKFAGIITGSFNLIFVAAATILGIPVEVLIVLGGILSIMIILLAWRVFKAGE